jgi:hypothetical protein
MWRRFLLSETGQHVLLLLAPFLLSPHQFHNGVERSPFLRNLSVTGFAPLISGVFLVGALAALYKVFFGHHVHFLWLVDISSPRFLFTVAMGIAWIGYSAALARFGAGHFLKEHALKWPLAFWCLYYGGTMTIVGALTWLGVGILLISMNWVLKIGILGLFVGLVFSIIFELKRRQISHSKEVSYQEWHRFNKITLALFMGGQGVMMLFGFVLFKIFG